MAPKRPPTKLSPPSDEVKITDEWGIYDPAKAGMPALFARLGRPILRAAPTNSRKERRRALRPERSAEGVGLAIAEARRRAGLDDRDAEVTEHPLVGGNPARAMRLALRAQAAVNAMGTPAAEPFVAPPQPPPPTPDEVAQSVSVGSPAAGTERSKKRVRKTARMETESEGQEGAVAETAGAEPARRTRARKAAGRIGARKAAPAPLPTAAPPVATAAPEPAQAPPAPSPGRPRGPVPLAAWAHAVADEPAPAARRADKRGFWRGIFRIPPEVALVEYAHGAKIHRLLIEAADYPVQDFI